MRTLVIGDIHGGLRALEQVMSRAAVSSSDSLIFLGDYVDGWSESSAVVDFVLNLSTRQSCIFIKGNHDVWCEDWLRTGYADKTWLFHGGQATAKSYEKVDPDTRLKHLRFMENMKWYYVDAQKRLFIHAGFTSVLGPEEEFQSDDFSWDRSLWETALMLDASVQPADYPHRLRLFSEIYIGHTPTLYYDRSTPMRGGNVWNVDTGAAFTGKLSVMDIVTKQYWQSDTVKDLYPGETGRNRH